MRASRLAKRLPCAVDALRHTITLEESSPLLPLKGTLLIRFDGLTGEITDTAFGSEMHVAWDNGTKRVYSVQYGAVI
jgi:hypothetical protein